MNYKKIYETIIDFRRISPISNGYTETHHVTPRSLGGSNVSSNLVELSAREHFICHLLLFKMQEKGSEAYYKMLHAIMIMKANPNGMARYINNRIYEQCKLEYSKYFSQRQIGEGNNQYGTRWVTNLSTSETFKVRGELPESCVEGRNVGLFACQACNTDFLQTRSKGNKRCPSCIANHKRSLALKPKAEKVKPLKLVKTKVELACLRCNNKFVPKSKSQQFCSKECGLRGKSRKIQDDKGNVFASMSEAALFYDLSVEAIKQRALSQFSEFKFV